ncbi:hypothetical protein [Chromobacterium subtsugae]|uniref:hypothetical protein n=1 Tax=Chromobacterium subtsugae TaxID=251747 RepID=UPI00128C98AB|nr:hypothetical protein [Chromobacterium subtsugae]
MRGLDKSFGKLGWKSARPGARAATAFSPFSVDHAGSASGYLGVPAMSVSDLKNGLPLAEHWLPLAGVRLAAAENEVERSAFGYVLKVQTTMKAILLNDPENGEKLVRAKQLLSQSRYTWGDLFEMEELCVELARDDMLAMIRPADIDLSLDMSEGDGVASAQEAAKQPAGAPAVSRAALRAAVLLGQQRFFRALRRERALDRLRFRLGRFTLALLLLGACYYWLSVGRTDSSLAVAAIFGILGAYASILQRIQDVGNKTSGNGQSGASVAMLMDGSWSLYLALASGVLFGILGFWLFAAGLGAAFLSSGLAPQFGPHEPSSDVLPYLLRGVDYGKMAVWAFFFGFAERFIPDLLTQLAKSGSANDDAGSGSAKAGR